jgi:thioredoxin-like negative regulator of GroEL
VDPISLAALGAGYLAVKSSEGFATAVGEAAWSGVRDTVDKLRRHAQEDPETGAALARAESASDDQEALTALARRLHRRQSADPELVRLLTELEQRTSADPHLRVGQTVQVAGNIEKQLNFSAPVNVQGDFNA